MCGTPIFPHLFPKNWNMEVHDASYILIYFLHLYVDINWCWLIFLYIAPLMVLLWYLFHNFWYICISGCLGSNFITLSLHIHIQVDFSDIGVDEVYIYSLTCSTALLSFSRLPWYLYIKTYRMEFHNAVRLEFTKFGADLVLLYITRWESLFSCAFRDFRDNLSRRIKTIISVNLICKMFIKN